tara:strand:- start:70 stop:279 length:210 start_codon:yes stop_codon:yes gene_type:complete
MTIRELIQQLETIENKDATILSYPDAPCSTSLMTITNARTKEIYGYSFKQIIDEDWLRLEDTSDLEDEY